MERKTEERIAVMIMRRLESFEAQQPQQTVGMEK
jgi:hypothetical protein